MTVWFRIIRNALWHTPLISRETFGVDFRTQENLCSLFILPLWWDTSQRPYKAGRICCVVFPGHSSPSWCESAMGVSHSVTAGVCVQLVYILENQDPERGTRSGHHSQDLPLKYHFYQIEHMTQRLHTLPKPYHQLETRVSNMSIFHIQVIIKNELVLFIFIFP